MFEFAKTYSTEEAATLLGFCSPSTLRHAAASNKIPGAFKRGQFWRIPFDYVQRRLDEESKSISRKNRVGRKRGQPIRNQLNRGFAQ